MHFANEALALHELHYSTDRYRSNVTARLAGVAYAVFGSLEVTGKCVDVELGLLDVRMKA